MVIALSDTLDNRLEIFDLMAELHQNGYHHFSLYQETVCFKDGKFRLIGLEDARRHADLYGRRFTCAWKGDSRKIKIGGYLPLDDLPCGYLLLTGTELRLWYPCQ